jgi:hypothetical protein
MRLGIWLAAAIVLSLASSASAHRGAPAWSVAKVERVVASEASVRVPRTESARIAEPLWTLVARYRTLEQVALDESDERAAAAFHAKAERLFAVLREIDNGVRVAVSRCDARGLRRAGHFLCAVLSEALVVPDASLVHDDPDALPRVVEGVPRRYGPYAALLVVHLRTGSSILVRQPQDSTVVRKGCAAGSARLLAARAGAVRCPLR